MWLLPQGLVNDMSAPAHEDRAVWAVNVALALASGRDGRGCHHTLRATARLVPDMLLLRCCKITELKLFRRSLGDTFQEHMRRNLWNE